MKKFNSYYSSNTKKNRKNKFCLDVKKGDCCQNVSLISYPCHNGTNQKFKYNEKTKHIVAQSSKKCLDVEKIHVIQKKCRQTKKSQKWKRKKNQWISLANNKCMDIEGEHYHSGHIVTYPCNNGLNQTFFKKD